jgi:LysM repeat protein/ABC-type branched-subunit amino acid transport system substrate-binding protein
MFGQNKKYETYTVQEGETIQSIARKLSITPYKLLQLNPELTENNQIEEGKILIVPNKNYNPATAAVDSGKDYIENGMLVHKVVPQENFFRLKKKFRVSKRILIKYNPMLRKEGLKAGQIIKFPVPRNYKPDIVEEQVRVATKPYLVRPKETKYGISRRYGISIEKLEELNPQIKEVGIKMTDIILVPDTDEIPDSQEGFSTHKVEKGETFFSLGELFEMTEEELIAANPVLNEGVKEGMLIKIPLIDELNTSAFVPLVKQDEKIKAILMLPLMSNKKNIDFEKNRTSDIATDFYFGAMIALDSVKKMGLSVDMKVFDTQNNKRVLSSLLSSGNLGDADVMIGPLFYGNVQFVAGILQNKQVSIVSPLSQTDHSQIPNDKLVQSVASQDEMIMNVLGHIKRIYKDENIVIVTDSLPTSMVKVADMLKVLQPLDSLHKITVLKPEKGYIKRELFLENVLEKRNNFVILLTSNAIVTTDAVQNLGSMSDEIEITLFGFNKGSSFKNVSNNDLARVNFHYTTSNYVDDEDKSVRNFIKKYEKKNFSKPSEYAFRGFDLTYDILLRLATHEDVNRALNAGYSKRVSSKYEYIKNDEGKGFVNQGMYLMKYDGLQIVKVEEEPIEEVKE